MVGLGDMQATYGNLFISVIAEMLIWHAGAMPGFSRRVAMHASHLLKVCRGEGPSAGASLAF